MPNRACYYPRQPFFTDFLNELDPKSVAVLPYDLAGNFIQCR
jgi:hypothetical protein